MWCFCGNLSTITSCPHKKHSMQTYLNIIIFLNFKQRLSNLTSILGALGSLFKGVSCFKLLSTSSLSLWKAFCQYRAECHCSKGFIPAFSLVVFWKLHPSHGSFASSSGIFHVSRKQKIIQLKLLFVFFWSWPRGTLLPWVIAVFQGGSQGGYETGA